MPEKSFLRVWVFFLNDRQAYVAAQNMLIEISSLCLLRMGLKIQPSTGLTFTAVCTLTSLQKVALKCNQNYVILLKGYIFEMRRLSIEMKLGTMILLFVYLFAITLFHVST